MCTSCESLFQRALAARTRNNANDDEILTRLSLLCYRFTLCMRCSGAAHRGLPRHSCRWLREL